MYGYIADPLPGRVPDVGAGCATPIFCCESGAVSSSVPPLRPPLMPRWVLKLRPRLFVCGAANTVADATNSVIATAVFPRWIEWPENMTGPVHSGLGWLVRAAVAPQQPYLTSRPTWIVAGSPGRYGAKGTSLAPDNSDPLSHPAPQHSPRFRTKLSQLPKNSKQTRCICRP